MPWSVVIGIARKDLRIEARNRAALVPALSFVVLVQLVVVFSRDSGAVSLAALAPGILWVTIALATLLVINRLFLLEREENALDVILLSPVPRAVLFWGKWLGNFVLIGLVAMAAVPVWVLFFNVPVGPWLIGVLFLCLLTAAGLSAVGTLFSAMMVRTRAAELLTPVLLLPFMLPPLFFSAQATVRLLEGGGLRALGGAFRFVGLFDLGFLILATMLFPMVVEE